MDFKEILFNKAKNGDIEAFEKLIEDYQKRVFTITLKIAGNRKDASEMAQQVFVEAYRRLSEVKEEIFLPYYLYKITTSLCNDKKVEGKEGVPSVKRWKQKLLKVGSHR